MKINKQSFTLIEVLLALSIFSVIALTLYGTFASGMRIEKRSEKINRTYREISWSLNIIEKDLESMVNYSFANSYPDRLSFVGDSENILFICTTDDGLKVVRYYLKPLEAGSVYKTIIGQHYKKNVSFTLYSDSPYSLNRLIRHEELLLADSSDDSSESVEIEVLNARVINSGLKFFYAYEEGDEENPSIVWKDKWTPTYLPSSVRIQLELMVFGETKDTIIIEKDIFIPTGFYGKENL